MTSVLYDSLGMTPHQCIVAAQQRDSFIMPVLTLRNESRECAWASLVASLRKDIETRIWSTRFRGSIIIHCAASPQIGPFGKIVAITLLDDCRPMQPEDDARACCSYYPDLYAWTLAGTIPLQPRPLVGAQRIFCRDVAGLLMLKDSA